MASVQLTAAAEQDLEDILVYIGRERGSPDAAARIVAKIIDKAVLYAEQPLLGAPMPELDTSTRSFLAFSYVVLYRPDEFGIQVLRVLHSAQDLRDVLGLR
jgi:toxin ParE1/3/4